MNDENLVIKKEKNKRLSTDSIENIKSGIGILWESLNSLIQLNNKYKSEEVNERIENIEKVFINWNFRLTEHNKKHNFQDLITSEIIEKGFNL